MVKDGSTENRILEAARRVFLKKGMAGARMQEIADEAGINKALLHYYFRSKDKLFDYILNEVVEKISIGLKGVFEKELSVAERMDAFVDVYIDVLLENRYLPLFVLNQINQNPEKFANLLRQHVMDKMSAFIVQMQKEIDQGVVIAIHPIHLLLNVMGLVIFPFAAFPLLSRMADEEFKPFVEGLLQERRTVVKEFVKNALTPKKQKS